MDINRQDDPNIFGVRIPCIKCRHWLDEAKCKAFPKGIPKVILCGDVPHTTVRPDQVGGYVYEFYDRPPKFNITV